MFKPQYKQLIIIDSSLSTCTKASLASSFVFSTIASFPHWASEGWYQYGSILLLRYTSLATLLCLASYEYWKCYINIGTQTCSGFYWYIRTLPWVLCALGIAHIYQSNPEHVCVTIYNVNTYIHIYVCTYIYTVVCTYVCMYVCMCVYVYT